MGKTTGIDASEWQKSIDWASVKSQIDFVILREGYRKAADKYFFRNVEGCKNNQIPIHGVYHFLYALNNQDVIAEAESCLANIEKAGLPKTIYVWADFEYDTVTNAAKKGVTLGPNECNLFTQTFCDFFKKRGYNTGIYTNGDYYKHWYRQDVLNKYPLWLADYEGGPDYHCLYQQYTNNGQITGINGNIDMNYYYGDKEETNMAKDLWSKTAELMAAESGYLEKASESNLDSKTGNAGYGNYTKYARDINNLGLMGCQGQPWCAVYQFWINWQIFGKEKALDIMGPGFYNCTSITNHAKSKGTWHSEPKLGALVIFRNGAHIGRVTKITSSQIYTNEGNTSKGGVNNVEANGGCVADKVYTRNYSGIDGYVWIDYTDSSEAVVRDYLQLGDTGPAVKTMQQNLITLGFDVGTHGADGSFGQDTLAAVKQAQEQYGLAVDGYYGPDTKAKIEDAIGKDFLCVGDQGNQVEELQSNLIYLGYDCGVSGADGDFGADTEAAVKAFQKTCGLDVDGNAGPKTLEKVSTEVYKQKNTQTGFQRFVGEVQQTCAVHKKAKKASPAIAGYPKLVPGNLVDVLGRAGYENNWYKVCVADQYIGYAWADSIKRV
jgi:hypothetical protein|nr:MAG TPA: PlyB like endolysin [Caudoviricetes sp.]